MRINLDQNIGLNFIQYSFNFFVLSNSTLWVQSSLLIDCPVPTVLSSTVDKSQQHQERNSGNKFWECWELNPGQLGEKGERYLCAMPPFKAYVMFVLHQAIGEHYTNDFILAASCQKFWHDGERWLPEPRLHGGLPVGPDGARWLLGAGLDLLETLSIA